MLSGQNSGDSASALTVDSAAKALEGLFPGDDPGDTQTNDAEPDETSETPPAAQDDDDAEEPVETSEDPDEDEEEIGVKDDDDAEPEEPVPAKPTHKVKIDGQEVEVTLEEALKGYSRQQDYTRKTQKHAEKEKAFEAEQAAVRAERVQHATKLVELDNILSSLSAEPDWDALRNEDPAAFTQTYAAYQIHKERLAKIRAEKEKALLKVQEDEQTALNATLEAEHAKIAEFIPDWSDSVKGPAARKELLDYGQSIGYSAKELGGITDSRALKILHKARLYDAAERVKAEVPKKAQAKIDKLKTAAPSGKKAPKANELQRRKQRLAQSGSVDDAASVLEQIFG